MQSKRHAISRAGHGPRIAWKESLFAAEIPMLDVVDFAGLRSGDASAVHCVGAEVGRVCRGMGFFYVRNHGIPDALLSAMFETSRAFFACPQAEKDELSIARSRHNRGYVGLSTESLDPSHA